MEKEKKNANNPGNRIGVGVALGAVVFALTKEPVWIAVGVAIGAAIEWTFRKKIMNKNSNFMLWFVVVFLMFLYWWFLRR